MIRVLAVLAHPKKDSHNGRFFYATVEHLKKQPNIQVDVLDLYEHAQRIPFYDFNTIKTNPFFLENKERIMAADRLLIMYPVWWYSVPGILKCWMDLISNYAWQYQEPYARPLHKITKSLVVNTAAMPNLFRWLFTRNSATETVKRMFRFMGIKQFVFYEIGRTEKLTSAQEKKHLEKIIKKSDWLIS